ncbi:MAG: glutaredoxin family protein [Candidatus Acidiferrales bacterium]
MEPIEKKILGTYDELEKDALDLHTLFEFVGGNPPAQREAVLDAATRLQKQGLLEEDSGGDFYRRTEAGRVAVAGPRDVTFYSRPGCHLCEEAKAAIVPLLKEFGARLREVNIDEDPRLRELYTNDVPVVFLGSRKVAKHRLDVNQFRKQLEQAGR